MIAIATSTFPKDLNEYVGSLDKRTRSCEEQIRLEYFKFVATYGKSYASMEHMDERYEAFKHNFGKISDHNSSVDESGRLAPFRMAINRFSDMTEEEFVAERLGTGALPIRNRTKTLKASHP